MLMKPATNDNKILGTWTLCYAYAACKINDNKIQQSNFYIYLKEIPYIYGTSNFRDSGPLPKSVSLCGGHGGEQQAHVLLLPGQ